MSEASGNRVEGTEEVAPPRSAREEFSVENDDALAALVNLIAVIGDNEFFLGRRVSEWADAGPPSPAPPYRKIRWAAPGPSIPCSRNCPGQPLRPLRKERWRIRHSAIP